MSMQMSSGQPTKWLGLPVIATIARILCRELTLQNEYLRLENKILKSKIKGRIRFTDDERRSLVNAALAMGRKLMESVVNIVKPATILAWQQRLEKQKWDYSHRRNRKSGRPRTPADIEALICEMARENIWGYKRIQGELNKLDIKISKTSVANILRLNAFAERWIRSLREECLNHLIIFGLSRLQHVLNEYKKFFNQYRPHQAIGNSVPGQLDHRTNTKSSAASKERVQPRDIQCQQFLGGLLKSYPRKVA